ncbi:uncharacterized protein LOC119268011 [Triticum dicoccoides]|uniref:uncharacterized protein LOC119268011 n=1 Tax=Triticum dicoccoides TaxID=85692 RepID=UPI001890B3B6|nr:uncharacterized protein LOC119268011 [Triticum dicoccoides]
MVNGRRSLWCGSETPPYNDVACCPRKESVPRFACVDRDFINVASILLVNLPFPLSDLAYGHWVLIASMSLVHYEEEDCWSKRPFILLKKLARMYFQYIRIFGSLMVLLRRYRRYQVNNPPFNNI